MSSSGIRLLPAEILRQVFNYFEPTLPLRGWSLDDPDTSQMPNLISLCLTCRVFRDMAQPLLFRNILISPASDEIRTCSLLIRTLLKRPSLGLNARVFSSGTGSDGRVEALGLDVSIMKNRMKEVLDLPPKFEALLHHHFSAPIDLNLEVLCMLFMPNLQMIAYAPTSRSPLMLWMLSGRQDLDLTSFFINNGLTEFDPDLNSSFESEVNESEGDESDSNEEPTKEFANFGLPALREIRMTARDHEGATEISEVEGAFLHPYVETIRSSGLDWRYEIALDQSWTSIKSNVRVLELADCVIDGKGLKDVFRRCPDLQSLSIRLGGDRRLIGVVGTMDPYKIHSIRDVLGKYGRKLNTLNLHTDIHDWWSSRDGNKSLTQLTKLRHLACFKNDFTGYKLPSDSYKLSPNPDSTVMKLKDVLPTGLETVYLHATYEDIHSVNSKTVNDDLYEVMMGSDFPNLLEVKVARRMQHKHPIVSDFRGWSVDRKVEELRQDDWALYGKYEVTSFRRGIPTEGVSRLTGPSAGGFCSNDHELL